MDTDLLKKALDIAGVPVDEVEPDGQIIFDKLATDEYKRIAKDIVDNYDELRSIRPLSNINRFSWNVNGQQIHDRDYFLQHIARYKPTTLLVFQSPETARQVLNVSPTTKVVHRFWFGEGPFKEGKEWWAYTPEEWVNTHTNWGNNDIYRYVINEPEFGDTTNTKLPAYIKWTCDVMDLMFARGFKAVVGNWGIGTWAPEDIDNGVFDPLLEKLHLYSNWHYLGLHEYTLAALHYGAGQVPSVDLLDPARMQPEHWTKPEQLPIARQSGKLPNYWHLLRCSWFAIRAEELGLSKPKIWLTEFAWDQVDPGNGIKDAIIAKWGVTPPATAIRGINALENVWKAYWGNLGWDKEQAAFEQYKWANSVYPDWMIGANTFMWTYDPFWKDKNGCDVSDLRKLHGLLEQESQKIVLPPIVDPPINIPPINIELGVKAETLRKVFADLAEAFNRASKDFV